MLTVHSSGGNTGKSKTRVKFYPAHGLLFSDVYTGLVHPKEGSLQHRISRCCQKTKQNKNQEKYIQQKKIQEKYILSAERETRC